MKVQKVKIEGLKHPEVNSRNHPKNQIEEIIKSYKMFGQTRPIVIDEFGEILIGNGFIMALNQLKEKEVYAIKYSGMSRKEKNKLILSDNATYNLGVNDNSNIDILLKQIANEDDFVIPGFDNEVIKSIYGRNTDLNQNILEITKVDNQVVEGIKNWSNQPSPTTQKQIAEELDSKKNIIICPACGVAIEIQ